MISKDLNEHEFKFDSTEDLIADIRMGKMVILLDDEDRENEGDLVLAADHVTPEAINFMASEARGLICLSLSTEQCERLKLQLMVREDENQASNKTAFTVSIEAATGVSTGISAADRARTIRVASHPQAKPSEIHTPGHIFPIRAQNGGVLKRAGHTEGSVDLAKLADLNPAAVICEVMNADGSMARTPDLFRFAKKHNLKIGSIVDLIEYRLHREILVEEVESFDLPFEQFRGFKARVFRSKVDQIDHLVLQKGSVDSNQPTLVRVHQDGYTKDLLSIMKEGTNVLIQSLKLIDQEGHGLVLLVRGSSKQSGLVSELRACLEIEGSKPMDQRDYGVGAQILRAMGVRKIKLMTRSMDKKVGLKAFDLEITEMVDLSER